MTTESVLLGEGEWTFEPVVGWPFLPADYALGDVAGLAVDARDRIVLFNRGDVPVIVVSPDGEVLDAWGEGAFANPHGASFGPDGSLYLTDNALHVVRKYTIEGELLLEIGVPGRAAPFMSNEPFNRCTHAAAAPNGDIYVGDGYGNAAVHRFSAEGEHLLTWGRPGARRGEFNNPHNIACDRSGRVYVADRENHRVQVFDPDGAFLFQLVDMHRPSGMMITADDDPVVLVGEMASYLDVNRDTPNLGPSIAAFALDNTLVACLRREEQRGVGPGQFLSPHSLAMDSSGSLYVGDVGRADWATLFPGVPLPEGLRSVQKLRRVGSR
ncbi:MAG: peptidyl-alpha-hydroxyglycine alpha-amidating lyase family protein [Arachnia sp.]